MKSKLIVTFFSLFLVGCGSSVEEEPTTTAATTGIEQVTVSYAISGQVVHTVTVGKGSNLGVDYVYDYDSHQVHIPTWKDANGNVYNKDTIINNDITIEGIQKTNLNIINETANDYVSIAGINHVHQDGKLVLLETYFSKNIVISANALVNNNDVHEIYLPRVINHLYSGNFQGCNNLTTIYYAGTMEQFDSIPKETFVLPSGVHMVYNVSFAS